MSLRPVRVSIHVPKATLQSWRTAAEEAGLSLSAWALTQVASPALHEVGAS